MNTAVINIRTDQMTKKKAQKVALKMGLSLSDLINGFLRQLVKTKTAVFTTHEEPTPYLIQALKESKADIKAGRVSPAFDNVEDSIRWLEDPNARFQNGKKVNI